MPYAALGARLLLLAAALAAFAAAASANGIPLKGNPDAKLRAGAANHCSVEGEALDAVQVPDPENCNQYYVCCGGQPVPYSCRVASKFEPNILYSDATADNSYYSPETGVCQRMPGTLTLKSFACPAASGVPPVTTDWAEEDVSKVGKWEIIAGPDGAASSTGAVAMHAALIPGSDKVLVWARRLADTGFAYPPGMSPNGTGEVAAVYDPNSGAYEVAPMHLAPFCSGQSHLADGTIIVAGGEDDPGGYLKNGLQAIRFWRPNATEWELATVELKDPHWYPTQMALGDGKRTLIAGGKSKESGTYVPTIEIYDAEKNEVTSVKVKFLEDEGILNLYPVLQQLPWTDGIPDGAYAFLIFTAFNGKAMYITQDNRIVDIQDMPAWPTPGLYSAWSAAGGHALLMLEPDNGYAAEYVMFGGSTFTGVCACDAFNNDNSYRIKVDAQSVLNNTWAYEMEKMPGGRAMVDAVLLPNGQVVLVNGAEYGNSQGGGRNGGGQARNGVLAAWLYDPKAAKGDRFSVLAASTIKRYYHSTALLLPSGDVLVMGSEQSDCLPACTEFNPPLPQFQAELFRPPYAFSRDRPSISSVSDGSAPFGGSLTVGYGGTVTGAALLAPGAPTHQLDMGKRGVRLQVSSNNDGELTVLMPPNGHVAQPGMHMLFLLNGDIPCTRAAWVLLTTE